MKKLFLVLAVMLVGMISFAQSDNTYSLTVVGSAAGTLWDYADTTSNGETTDAIIRLKSTDPLNLTFQIVFDELTGTSTGTGTFYGSNDGTTWQACADSISTALTADGSIWVHKAHFGYSYCKVLLTTTGTETSTAKLYYSIRKE